MLVVAVDQPTAQTLVGNRHNQPMFTKELVIWVLELPATGYVSPWTMEVRGKVLPTYRINASRLNKDRIQASRGHTTPVPWYTLEHPILF